MILYLPCSCTGDYFEFIAIVQLSKDDIKNLLQRRSTFINIHTTDGDVYEVSYWDGGVEWYEISDSAGLKKKDYDRLCKLVSTGMVTKLPARFRMSKLSSQARVECERLAVCEQGFYWKCYPKHSDERLSTYIVEWKEIGG